MLLDILAYLFVKAAEFFSLFFSMVITVLIVERFKLPEWTFWIGVGIWFIGYFLVLCFNQARKDREAAEAKKTTG